LKGAYFPIANARVVGGTHPNDYASEGAYLPYPLDPSDDDPEELITFDGAKAVPKWTEAQNVAKYRRGRVTIDFFDLNRDELTRFRAAHLLNVWAQFQLAQGGNNEQAKRRIKKVLLPQLPFVSCTKQFLRVCETDRAKAEDMTLRFEVIVDSQQS
jgi:hypothetical protein